MAKKFLFDVYPNTVYAKRANGKLLSRWLRSKNEDAKYEASYQLGAWDGYENFYNRETRQFPTGLLRFVVKRLERCGIPYALRKKYSVPRVEPLTDQNFLQTITFRDYQMEAVNKALKEISGVIAAATGSGKSAIIAAIAGKLFLDHGVRTLIIVPKLGLLYQMVSDLKRFLGEDFDIGMVGDGHRSTKSTIVVATPQTLRFALPEEVDFYRGRRVVTRKHEPTLMNLVRSCKCLIVDEAHRTSGDSTYQICLNSPAIWRFGLSGTPLKGKRWSDLCLYAVFRKIIYRVRGKDLVDRDILAKPVIYAITDYRIFGDTIKSTFDYATDFRNGILHNGPYNKYLVRLIKLLIKLGKPPIVFSPRIPHIKKLARMLEKKSIPFEIITGPVSVQRRVDIKDRYKSGEQFAILASTVLDEGEDVPNTYSLVLAGGGKTHIALRQRIGRGMRRKNDDNRVLVFDFSHSHMKILSNHYEHRSSAYRSDGYEVIPVDNVDELSTYL